MRSWWRLLSVGVMCAAMVCPVAMAARPKLPVPSSWQLDELRSDFGGGPQMKADVFTVTSDKPNDLSVQFVRTDASGQTFKSSWSGPQNGTMLPVEGMPGATFGIDGNGGETWMFADGSRFDGVLSVSKDRKTVLVRGTLTGKDGRVYQQVLMYGRQDQVESAAN